MKTVWISATMALAAASALAAQGWDWNNSPAPTPPAVIMPAPDPCTPGPGSADAKDCSSPDAAADDTLQDNLAPPAVAGPVAGNRAKKASQ